MQPDFIDWDDSEQPNGNVQHIQDNGLTTGEIEEILDDPDARTEPSSGAPPGVERWITFGWTSYGRYIAVVYEILCDEPYGVRPITAFEPSEPDERE